MNHFKAILILGIILFVKNSVFSQTIMFDDFNYNGINDPSLSSFNKWNIIDGISGPPSGGLYHKENIAFIVDPDDGINKLMTLKTTVNGQTDAITHSRIETQGFEYFEGTYAARVYYSEVPFQYNDANIQTFYTIVNHTLSGDGSKYSELDFEYMASDKWGISADNQVMYLTSWNRYIAEPWQAWKRYWAEQKSYEGWHTFVVSCTDGINVKYYMDGVFITSMATTDNDGTSVYPRSDMQVAFANWIWNSVIGNSNDNRNTTMKVDWVLFQKDTELSTTEVNTLVNNFKSQGITRRNLLGQTDVITNIDFNNSDESISVYPNPASNILTLSSPQASNKKAKVINSTGQTVLTPELDTNEIDVSSLNPGIYCIEIIVDNQHYTRKFIKQ